MAQYSLAITTDNADEPVTLAEAKHQCGIGQDRNELQLHNTLNRFIKSARHRVETDTGLTLMTKTYDFITNSFPLGLDPIYLPRWPVTSITHVKYYDTSGSEQTLATSVYKTILARQPAEIRLKASQQWPSLYSEPAIVTVRFVAGYSSALTVPDGLKQAILLLVSHWYDNRNAVGTKTIQFELAQGYQALVDSYNIGDEFHVYAR